jgi:hypothetical protein
MFGLDGATVSIVTLKTSGEEVTPFKLCRAAIDQTPSDSSGSEQASVVWAAVKEQVFVSEALVAVSWTSAPTTNDETEISGVESLVIRSLFDAPLSDAAVSTGVAVCEIAMGPTASEVAVWVPPEFVPVAFTRICLPTSSTLRTRVLAVAPNIDCHVTPSDASLSH